MLVECVPNFSEGRKPEVVELIAQAIRAVGGATVLNRHIDSDHNRSVITLSAQMKRSLSGAKRVAKGNEMIDLDSMGVASRIGATDVLRSVR